VVRPILGVRVLTLLMEPPNATLASMKKVDWKAGRASRGQAKSGFGRCLQVVQLGSWKYLEAWWKRSSTVLSGQRFFRQWV